MPESVVDNRSDESRAKSRSRRAHALTFLYLGFTILLWGSNWPMLKLAVAEAPPIAFTVARLLGSAAILAILLLAWRLPLLPERGERVMLAWSGFLQIGALLGANMIGLQFMQPGRAAVLTFTMPLWAIPLSVWLLHERPHPMKIVGGLVGLLGLAGFFDPAIVDWRDRGVLIGNGAILVGAFCWAAGAVLYRRRRWRTGFWTQTFWQILLGGVPLLPVSFVFEGHLPVHFTGTLFIAWAFTALLGTAVSYWCWAKVLTDMPASTAGQFTMLVPVLAFFYSVVFFGDRVTLHIAASAALIFAGILLTLRTKLLP
ncbi:MAG TPA: DMT family transporter [Alphaproteobacteria bacterium]|nr:DMT family transporter [Alphaproteobacteria bacterium]